MEVPAPRLVVMKSSTTTGLSWTMAPPAATALTKAGLAVAWRPSSTPSSAKIEGAAQIAAIASPSSARRSTSAWIAGVAFRFVVPGRPPGRNKTV